MKNLIDIKKLATAVAAFAFGVLALSTCRNPLVQVGLGDKVDLEPPELAVTSHQNGDYLHDTETLAGTFADDLGISAVRISLDDGATFQDADLGDGDWTFELVTTDIQAFPGGDGEYEIVVRATDGAGKSLERRLLLYVDNHPPVVLVKVPTGYTTGEYNGEFSIKGEATDQYGINKVELEVWDSAGTTLLLPPVVVTGTSSWSYTFNSTSYNADLHFRITAWDRSGNTNAYLYHYDDVYAANGATVTVEQVYSLDQGVDLGLTLEPEDMPGLQMSALTLTVDQALDLPDFIISNPDEEAPPEQKVLGNNARAIGMVLDDDGVAPASIRISLDGGAFVPVTQVDGSGVSVRWQHDLSALGGGPHTLQLRAQDIYDVSNDSNLVSFSIDLGAPTVEVTSPPQGSYRNATFLIQGTAFDSEGVASVKVSTNGGADYYNATNTGVGYSTWQYSAAVPGDGLADGNRTVKIMATDTSGKSGYTNLQVIVDTQNPTINFLIPASSSTINGEVLLRGTASDNTQITKVELKIGASDPWIQLAGTYNWEYSIDSVSYANATHAVETPPGSQVWKLTIQARATDAAGNPATLSSYYLFIDNDLDKPTVNIVSPANGQNIGGSVLVTGTAFDDDAVHHVEMRLDLNGDGDFTDSLDLNGDLDFLDKFEQEGLWYPVSGTTLWTQELNGSGELYQTQPGHTGDINLRVRAVDTKDLVNPDIVGNFQQLAIHFDNTIPRIESLNLGSGDYVKGSFTLTGDALDDTQVTGIYLSYDGGVNYTNITGDASKVTQNAPNDYDLHVSIDSASYIPASGILYLRLKVVDNANYQKIEYLNLNVDNVYPTGAYTGAAADIYGSTLNARLQGTAEDSGSVSGVQAVEVYFIRGGTVYSPRNGATTAAGSFDFGAGPVPYVADSAYRIRIDNRYELGTDAGGNGDADGFDESFTLAGSTYNWWAQFDSALISDGLIDIHFVVYDQAGNGRHYAQAGFIKNHKPSISSITVGSDVDATGVVEPDERFAYSVPIQARNRLYIGINAADNAGGLQYAVYHDPGGANTLVWTDPNASSQTLNISAFTEGATTFRCLVTDSDGIQTESTLVVTIANLDTVDPAISISALTQADAAGGHAELEGASLFHGTDPDVSGVVTLKGSASDNQRIAAITVTITNFNAGSGVGLEHTVASWVGATLVSADANFVLNTQTLTESGGHQVTWTYTWNTAGVTGSAGTGINALFEVTDFTSPTGRTGNYARGYDVVPYITSVTTPQTANGGLKANNIRSSLGRYSIKTGAVADFISIQGFNLNPIANGVRVSSATYKSGLNGTTLMGNSLAVNSVSGDRTLVTVSNNTSASGYLTVVSGSAAAPVPSTNNLNDNEAFEDLNLDTLAQLGEKYNREPDEAYIKNRLLTDDRYADFFTVTDTGFTSSFYPNMLMDAVSPDTPLWGYVQGGAANDLQVRRGTSSASNIGMIRILAADQLAMARDEDGIYHMVSINNFNNGRLFYLYNIYETTPGYAPDGGAISPYWTGYGGVMAGDAGNNAIALDSVNYTPGLMLGRYANTQLVVKGRSNTAGQYSRVYLGYYDQSTGELLFRNFRVGLAGGANNLYNTGRSNQADTSVTTGDAARKLISSSASQYFAMGVTDEYRVIFVYFDQAAGKLKLTYSTAPTAAVDLANPTNAVTFSTPVELPVSYVGWYVSLVVENDGNAGTPDALHIAAYDTSDGDLRYIYMASYADAGPQVVRVDANNSVGIYTSVKIRGGKPWIAYYNNSENGTRDSIKLARYLGSMASVTNGAGADGYATGDWEYLTVPVGTPPQGGLTKFLKVNLDFNSSGDPILGYAASSIEHSRRLPEVTP